jgi:hypothetical protein
MLKFFKENRRVTISSWYFYCTHCAPLLVELFLYSRPTHTGAISAGHELHRMLHVEQETTYLPFQETLGVLPFLTSFLFSVLWK